MAQYRDKGGRFAVSGTPERPPQPRDAQGRYFNRREIPIEPEHLPQPRIRELQPEKTYYGVRNKSGHFARRENINAVIVQPRNKILGTFKREGAKDRAVLPRREHGKFTKEIQATPYIFKDDKDRGLGKLRQSRFEKLIKYMTPEEAEKFSQLPISKLSFLNGIIKERARIIESVERQGEYNGWSKERIRTEIEAAIRQEYKYREWNDAKGNNNPFSMLRDFRHQAISDGEWNPADSPSRKRGGKLKYRWKGDVKGQHERYRHLYPDRILAQKAKDRERARQRRQAALH
jgi:hypothetical protein